MSYRRGFTALAGALLVMLSALGPGVAAADEVEVTGTIQVAVAEGYEMPHCTTDALGASQQGLVGWAIDEVTPGNTFTVTATSGGDFDVLFFASADDCAAGAEPVFASNEVGDEAGTVPTTAAVALVIMWVGAPGSEFVYREQAPGDGEEPPPPSDVEEPGPRAVTVVAVIDGGFSPYHFDFVGHQHPWNVDGDPDNDLDFRADPTTYVSGHPGATPLPITVPTDPDADIDALRGQDAQVWAQLQPSTLDDPKMYWFPGTKVIGALSFENADFAAGNDSHGTRSAASAAGNLHGTCPECLFVLVNNTTPEALEWVTRQPWIDVVTNSYGHSVVGGPVRDNVYFGSPVSATREAAEAGQTIVFSAGNGLANAFDVPMFTYWSSEKGPDWMVTVGAVDPAADQTYSGAGKPVDISSYGTNYPSTGGNTATGTGTHSGTSNAAPTVAGSIARVIQVAREVLGDTTGGHSEGVVARAGEMGADGPGQSAGKGQGKGKGRPGSGSEPFACGDANPDCPLSDGVLTAVEARQVVFENVLPSDLAVPVSPYPWWPSTEYTYYYQGHGVVHGRLDEAGYVTEQQQFTDALTGRVASFERPAGETTWMQVDSKCRQRLWGTWSGGYYDGVTEPDLQATSDPLASLFNAWCSQAPQDLFADQAD